MSKHRKKKDQAPEPLSPDALETVERLSPPPPFPYTDDVKDGDLIQRHYCVRGAPGLYVQMRLASLGYGRNQVEVYEPEGDTMVLLSELSEALGKLLLGRKIDAESFHEIGAFLRERRKAQGSAALSNRDGELRNDKL